MVEEKSFKDVFGFQTNGQMWALEFLLVSRKLTDLAAPIAEIDDELKRLSQAYTAIANCASMDVDQAMADHARVAELTSARETAERNFDQAQELAKKAGFEIRSLNDYFPKAKLEKVG